VDRTSEKSLSAQLFRADLFSRDGFVVWDSQWFGGHATLPYSILAAAVSALLGPVAVAVVSGASRRCCSTASRARCSVELPPE
jgi:hypothetical protein